MHFHINVYVSMCMRRQNTLFCIVLLVVYHRLCMHVQIHVRSPVCNFACVCARVYVYVCMYSIYVYCTHLCMHGHTYPSMYVPVLCVCIHTYIHCAGQRSLTDMMARTEDRRHHKPPDNAPPSESILQKYWRHDDGGNGSESRIAGSTCGEHTAGSASQSHSGENISAGETERCALDRLCDATFSDHSHGTWRYEPPCLQDEEGHAGSSEVQASHALNGHHLDRIKADRQTMEYDDAVRTPHVQQLYDGGDGADYTVQRTYNTEQGGYSCRRANETNELLHVGGEDGGRLRDVSEQVRDADLEACIDDQSEQMRGENWRDRSRNVDMRHGLGDSMEHHVGTSSNGHVSGSSGCNGHVSGSSGCNIRANMCDTNDITNVDSGEDDQRVRGASKMGGKYEHASVSDGAKALLEADGSGSSGAKRRRVYERHEIDESVLREVGSVCRV
jgi:hypothetical protein